ncbi:8934_t:CDS:2, partial [Gigaspora rosea]
MTLSMKTKQEICQRKNEVPSLSIDQLSEEYSSNRASRKKKVNRPAKFVELENAMDIWMQRVFSQNGILTDGILQVQAKKFAELLDIPEDDFKASHSWVDRFKRRHNVQKFKIHGESESVPVENLPEERRKLVELLLQYKPNDVYNADETDQITVLLCTNATGTDKLKPLVIGKSLNSRCFKGVRKANLGVEYDSSKKAWMTSAIFERWINSLNSLCRRNRKKILLLVD